VKVTKEQHAPLEAIVWGMLLAGGATPDHALGVKGPLARFLVDLPEHISDQLVDVMARRSPRDIGPYVDEVKSAVRRERSNDQV